MQIPSRAMEPSHSVIQLPSDSKRRDQVYEDINQDGLRDLVVAVSQEGKRFARSLRIYYQRRHETAFVMEPDEIIPLTADVIAFACADTDPHPGTEILLFTANACFGYRLQEEEQGRLYKITACDFLWQLPDSRHVFSWQGAILDFDGDKRMDIFLPQAGGLQILLQQSTGFAFTPLMVTPREKPKERSQVHIDRTESSTTINLGIEGLDVLFGADPPGKPLVSIRHAVEVPILIDWDGDRRIDVVTQTAKHLHVWQQGTDGTFQKKPRFSSPLPIEKNDKKHIDLSRSQYILDLNNDRRCDFLLFTQDRNNKRLFTQILVYLHPEDPAAGDSLFGAEGIPTQLIKVAGLPGSTQLEDINQDGTLDLSFLLFRPDLLDQVKTVASKSITMQFLVYFNHRGQFSRTPDITQDVHISFEKQGNSEYDQGRFLVDFNGDGLRDLLVRDKNNHLGLRLLKKTRSGITITKAHAWELSIPENGHLVFPHGPWKNEPTLFIVSSSQINHVRFR